MIYSKIIMLLKHIVYDAPAFNSIYRGAHRGFPNCQLQLAEWYLERADYVEAYAWAEVGVCRNLSKAFLVKQIAEKKLSDNDIKKAWALARRYKSYFLNNKTIIRYFLY